MRKIVPIFFFLISLLSSNSFGLKSHGMDSVITNKSFGFDFVMQRACTSSSNYPGCFQHFYFAKLGNIANRTYELGSWLGYGIKIGKMNLDSVNVAPPDSVFYLNDGVTDIIHPDSLFSRIGDVYLIRSGTDPRLHNIVYAKIKILDLSEIDKVNLDVKMKFLWVDNDGAYKDLSSSGLDTFHLTTSVNALKLSFTRQLSNNSQYFFT